MKDRPAAVGPDMMDEMCDELRRALGRSDRIAQADPTAAIPAEHEERALRRIEHVLRLAQQRQVCLAARIRLHECCGVLPQEWPRGPRRARMIGEMGCGVVGTRGWGGTPRCCPARSARAAYRPSSKGPDGQTE